MQIVERYKRVGYRATQAAAIDCACAGNQRWDRQLQRASSETAKEAGMRVSEDVAAVTGRVGAVRLSDKGSGEFK
jgi:hypothetical protein